MRKSKENVEPESLKGGKCEHDRGIDWSYYPENNYNTQKTYSKKENPVCPFCPAPKAAKTQEDIEQGIVKP